MRGTTTGRALWRWCAALALLAGLLAGWLPGAHPASAATQTVTNTNDSGSGSLRAAIAAAAAGDTIAFALPSGSTLITLTTGQITLDKNLTIQGPGANLLTISGNRNTTNTAGSRIFYISGGIATISGLTIANGSARDATPGTLTNQGGGILIGTGATLNLTGSALVNNQATGAGGGLYNQRGKVAITGSTLSGNSVTSDGGNGGAIANNGNGDDTSQPQAIITIANSTIANNSASQGTGGAIRQTGGGSTTMTHVTVNGNGASSGGAQIAPSSSTGTMALRNSVVANSASGRNCNMALTGFDHDVDDGATCGFGNTNGNISGQPVSFAPLTNNGGATQTLLPLAGNPVIDNANTTYCPTIDQRGYARPQGAACDIGAVEQFIPLPVITGLLGSPTPVVPAGAPPAQLTIQGSGFAGAGFTVVYLNGTKLIPTSVTSTTVTVDIPATLRGTAGTYPVTVFNGVSGGGASNAVNYVVQNVPPTITNLSSSATGNATATAGSGAITLTVTGTDFVAGTTLDFGNQLFGTTVTSGTTLTSSIPASALRAAGTILVRVIAPGPGGGASNTLSFIINPAGANQVDIAGGAPQGATIDTAFGTPFSVTVRDASGNPVGANVPVTFTAPSSGASGTFAAPAAGSVSADGTTLTVNTDANGAVTAPTFTANGIAGSYSVIANAGGGAVPFALTNLPGTVARFTVSAPASATAGQVIPLTVTALDSGGNVVRGYVGTVHFTSDDAQATLPADYTFVAGDRGSHTFTATLRTSGNRTITVADTVATSATGTATVAVAAAVAASVTASGGGGQSAQVNTAFVAPLTVTVRDDSGNPIAGVTVTFAAPTGGATATFSGAAVAAALTDINGLATSPAPIASGTVGSYTITATVAGVGTPAGFALANTAAPAQRFIVTVNTVGGGTVAPGSASYDVGTVASFSAAPVGGQVFTGWTLDGRYVGYASPLTLTVDADHALIATFAARPAFSDVPTTDPDYTAITTLAALGIVNPTGVNGSGQFQPDRPVVRAEIAAFIARTFGWEGEFHANRFPDRCSPASTDCIDGVLWDDIAALADYGVVGGYTDGPTCAASGTTSPCYLPRESVLRLQAVSIVARAFTKTPDLRQTGFWDRLAAVAAQYTNVPDSGTQRSDLATYRANAGPVPGQMGDASFPAPTDAATRRFVIEALWQAYNAQFGIDRVP